MERDQDRALVSTFGETRLGQGREAIKGVPQVEPEIAAEIDGPQSAARSTRRRSR
jgi:hypothetical protein